jgi:hypothetical protein
MQPILWQLFNEYEECQLQNSMVTFVYDPGTGALKKKSPWEPSSDD